MTLSAKVEYLCLILLACLFTSSSSFSFHLGNTNTRSIHVPSSRRYSSPRRSLRSISLIQRSATSTAFGNPAILDRPMVERRPDQAPAKVRRRMGSDHFEVRIYNDGLNTREFVARCLVQYAGLGELAAYRTMMQAHQNGIAVVGRYVYEVAEMYHDALKNNGIICDITPVDMSS